MALYLQEYSGIKAGYFQLAVDLLILACAFLVLPFDKVLLLNKRGQPPFPYAHLLYFTLDNHTANAHNNIMNNGNGGHGQQIDHQGT
ncbi:hypothetical protein [Thalassospira alkalitolerans]|uniref:hypothetical protein n=1 Tax=Thalassospira alkalitolerans TaxID=1293890 RepID=UPI0030EE8AF2